MRFRYTFLLPCAWLAVNAGEAIGQDRRLPVIDMHLHAMAASSQGPPPQTICAPFSEFPVWDPASSYLETFARIGESRGCEHPVQSEPTDDALMRATFERLERHNIIGVASGPLEIVERWKSANPDRIIPALLFSLSDSSPSPEMVLEWADDERIAVFGEVTIQYQGIEPNDDRFEPYLEMAERADLPIGIHIGMGPPGAPYIAFPSYRGRMHSPLSLEDPLMKHPRLRIYVQHAGWPMLDDTLALLYAHPRVYVGLGAISFGLPRVEFHRYLRTLVQAGFGNRVMFGSDQMVWPGVIDVALESIDSAEFLSAEQKRDILYNNAARFLRFSEARIAAHHALH